MAVRTAPVLTADQRWNHNIHYQRLVLDRIPSHTASALDVGCGEGMLTRELRRRVPHVIGIDRHQSSIELAREASSDIEYVLGDVLDADLAPADFVASIATLHHMDTATGLTRLGRLTKPGGRLLIVGCAKRNLPHDLPWELAGTVKTRALKLRHGYWEHAAPIADPVLTHAQTRTVALGVLPGARYRQLALWRYLLDWTRPG